MYGSGRPQRGVREGEAHESLDIGRDDVVDHERILGERYHANQGRHSLATSGDSKLASGWCSGSIRG